MDRKKAICEYLRQNHIGKEKAIHSKELEKLFMLDGRNIRRKISALRQAQRACYEGVQRQNRLAVRFGSR